MRKRTYIKEDELYKKGISLLLEKLGPIETNRFLSLSKGKRVESVKRHREWQGHLNKKKFIKEIFG